MTFEELRAKYPRFVYEDYGWEIAGGRMTLKFTFSVDGPQGERSLVFEPTISMPMDNVECTEGMDLFVFHIGMIELISYWKATCSPEVYIACGMITMDQEKWFQKLYYYGLGELMHRNGIKVSKREFMKIRWDRKKRLPPSKFLSSRSGTIIPIGGGKDSCITLELVDKSARNLALIVNPKEPQLECARLGGFEDSCIVPVERVIDKRLLELNAKGYINGHTPFSAWLAFFSVFLAYVTGRRYIALSNESSSDEVNVVGTKINHQYSKSYEFERDFALYRSKFLADNIRYFSFLRSFSELQIAEKFAKPQFEKYHKVFRSCNVGSKKVPWEWCCECPKCLFVYVILSPFMPEAKLVEIFGENLLKKESLADTLRDLKGEGEAKPFECVGTYEEVNWALNNPHGG